MRISSQNNQFIFNLPQHFISRRLEEQFQSLLDKNHIPYNDIMDYINATIKDIVFPSMSFGVAEQKKFHGKNIKWREAGNVMDKFQGDLDITFRSVDSHLNYFIILQILNDFYLSDNPNYLDSVQIKVLDKDGDLIYNVILKSVLFKSLSEIRMQYYATDFNENTFTLQFSYNFLDIVWDIKDSSTDESISIFDIPTSESNPRDVSNLEKELEERKKDSINKLFDN